MVLSTDAFKALPSVEKLASDPTLTGWEIYFAHSVRVRLARKIITQFRESLQKGELDPLPESTVIGKAIVSALEREYQRHWDSRMQKAINATGVVLHTNLGRAPLGREALSEMVETLEGYCTLEWDKAAGDRGSRTACLEQLLTLCFEAEGALVVNNNAAALFLTLHELARDRSVIISRGELVQIGGGFRIPEILESSGAKLVEIGTTNITEAGDYQRAIAERSGELGLILKVHQSCFRIEGHTESVPARELAPIARAAGAPLVVDLGSGQALDEGVGEPTISETLASGAGLICFSADKLLGGPQAGILLGEKALIARLKRAPLYRALRPGKTEIFLLERALLALAAGRISKTSEAIRQSTDQLRARAENISKLLAETIPGIELVQASSSLGGGTTPGVELPTWLLELPCPPERAEALARALLDCRPTIVPRRENKRLRLDLRTVLVSEEPLLCESLRRVWTRFFSEGS